MTPETSVAFIKSITNDPNVGPGDPRVGKLFTNYNKNKDDKLTKEEFLEFYRSSSADRSDIVWNNLTVNHYGNDLKPISYNNYSEDDILELIDKTLLTRYKMSSNRDVFN